MWELCSIQPKGRTDWHVKLVVGFSNFTNAPKEGNVYAKVYTTFVESHKYYYLYPLVAVVYSCFVNYYCFFKFLSCWNRYFKTKTSYNMFRSAYCVKSCVVNTEFTRRVGLCILCYWFSCVRRQRPSCCRKVFGGFIYICLNVLVLI
jgi:hypothetical protein